MRRIHSLFILSLLSLGVFAQDNQKFDVILKLNGDELTGKVAEITTEEVKFAYKGETLTYVIPKADILKITYASGRIEVFNKNPLPSETAQSKSTTQSSISSESHHNKVAILPFTFVRDGQSAVDAMSDRAQQECFNYLSKHSGMYTILEPRTTNALLIKGGVNAETIKGFTMDDLCNILGVEYVMEGIIMVNKTTQTSYASGTNTQKSKTTNESGDKKKTSTASAYATTTQNYETSLNLNVFNDKGSNVFGQERKSFWQDQDAYKSTLEYLLKRTPFYQK